MKLTPRYDYYLWIDGEFHPIPYKVWRSNSQLFLEIKDTEPTLVASNQEDLYRKFEINMNKTLMRYHLNGELWKFFPGYDPSFAAETVRIVCYNHVPFWRRLWNKLLFQIRRASQ